MWHTQRILWLSVRKCFTGAWREGLEGPSDATVRLCDKYLMICAPALLNFCMCILTAEHVFDHLRLKNYGAIVPLNDGYGAEPHALIYIFVRCFSMHVEFTCQIVLIINSRVSRFRSRWRKRRHMYGTSLSSNGIATSLLELELVMLGANHPRSSC